MKQLREDVAIVLNEREPPKRELAARAVEQLEKNRICAARIIPSLDLVDTLRRRSPRVVVLDYLLGDMGTAIDVLEELTEQEFILWTDEPSLGAAVQAMKAGARDYIDSSRPSSIERVIESVSDLLRQRFPTARHSETEIIAHSPAARAMLDLALIQRNSRAIIFYGAIGTGRSTIAKHVHLQREFSGLFEEIDLELPWIPQLPDAEAEATLCFEHCGPSHDTALLNARSFFMNGGRVYGATTDEQVAERWARALNAPVIVLPSLHERNQEIRALAKLFTRDLRRKSLDESALNRLEQCRWPGNIAELRAVSLELALSPEGADIEPMLERWERFHGLRT